jgi:mannosidase alpha-like ER degradation enhancer 1/mannosidase alpha-like ER degradation enhancer 2
VERAEKLQHTWEWLWDKYGLEPMVYDYSAHTPNYPVYDLNPEIIESAFYLYQITGEEKYREMALRFYQDILEYCKTDIAFTAIENVETMEKRDYMATYFIAETLKYFYLVFQDNPEVNINDYVFSTEAHNFKKEQFDPEEVKLRLGI